MSDEYQPILSPEERAARRTQRIQRRKQRQRAQRIRFIKQLFPVAALALALATCLFLWKRERAPAVSPEAAPATAKATSPTIPEKPEISSAVATATTVQLGESIESSYAVLIDLQSDTVLAQKNAGEKINPASMTKVLTLLVASEHIEDLDDTFTMTIDITDYCFVNSCSVVGLNIGETVSIRELLYGTILPSGADASLALATYVAGSHEAFVELMNEKLEELGLSDTAHFTNCVGIYDINHYCTVYDMAMILKAAMENELCREVLRAHTYETVPTTDHPDGQILSNWFLRRIEDRELGDIEVVAGKTGYVMESGSCAASAGQDPEGSLYLCVTGDASSSWRCIYDHAALYKDYCN